MEMTGVTSPPTSVGEAVRHLRETRGWSARHLSEIAGLSPSYVNKVETGAIVPSIRTFARLAKALNMTYAEVMFILNHEAVEEIR